MQVILLSLCSKLSQRKLLLIDVLKNESGRKNYMLVVGYIILEKSLSVGKDYFNPKDYLRLFEEQYNIKNKEQIHKGKQFVLVF